MKSAMQVVSVNVASARRVLINGRSVMTAIGKVPVGDDVDVLVKTLGLAGDEQADLSVHGGPSKAVYAYPLEHYAFWNRMRAEATQALDVLAPGAVGENLTLQGVLEDALWIGDELRLPHCTLVVSEPRFPCFKFNAAMGWPQAARQMVQSGTCGAYLSVRVAGHVRVGDTFSVLPGPREVRLLDVFRARAR